MNICAFHTIFEKDVWLKNMSKVFKFLEKFIWASTASISGSTLKAIWINAKIVNSKHLKRVCDSFFTCQTEGFPEDFASFKAKLKTSSIS